MPDGGEDLLDAEVADGVDGDVLGDQGAQAERVAGVLVGVVQPGDRCGDVADRNARDQLVSQADHVDHSMAGGGDGCLLLMGSLALRYPVQDGEPPGGHAGDDVLRVGKHLPDRAEQLGAQDRQVL
jgi:hypothetical protein